MIPGYNHNVHYKDQVFHIQTEDSGVENPHIITHLFLGGNIIKTTKTSYSDIINSDRRDEMLVELMQDQHKTMLKGLIKGQCDSEINMRSANAATLDGPAPLNVDAGAQHRASFGLGGAAEAKRQEDNPASAFFGDAPTLPGNETIIEASTLERAFDAGDNAVDSIFGEDLISEKSLDEVILSYLAEDMQKE